MHRLAITPLMAFLQKLNYRQEIKTMVVSWQVAYIDLLIMINDNLGLLIESKTNSEERGDQL